MGDAKKKSGAQVFRVLVSAADRFELAQWVFRKVGVTGREDRKPLRRAADALGLREYRSRILDEAPKVTGGGITPTPEEIVAIRRAVALTPDEAKAPARKFTVTVENIEILDKVAQAVALGGDSVIGGFAELVDDMMDMKANPPEDGALVAVGSAATTEDDDEDEPEDDDDEAPAAPAETAPGPRPEAATA